MLEKSLSSVFAGFSYSLDVAKEINVDWKRVGLDGVKSLLTLDLCGTESVDMQDESLLMSRVLKASGSRCCSPF